MRTSFGWEGKGMVHSVCGWTRGVEVKLWDPLRTRAIPERLGVFTTRRCTNPRLPFTVIVWHTKFCAHLRRLVPSSTPAMGLRPVLRCWFSNKYQLDATKRNRYTTWQRRDERDLLIIDNRLWRGRVFVLLATSRKTNRQKDGGQLHHDKSHYIPDKKVYSASST